MAQTTFKSVAINAFLAILILLWVGIFMGLPQWHQYTDGKVNLAAAEIDNQNLQQARASLQGFIDSYRQQNKNVQTVNLVLPAKTEDTANFAASIGQLASLSGVVLSNFSVNEDNSGRSKEPLENSIRGVPISFAASGSYPSFRDFILRLESHQRLVDIQHLTLKEDDNGLIQYQINLVTYYQK